MPIRSTEQSYGATAIAIHWVTAAAIILLLTTGQVMDFLGGAENAPLILVIHVALGMTALLLTLARLAWFAFADRRPRPHASLAEWQKLLSRAVHGLLYVAILLLASSGIATLILSGAGAALIAGHPVPDIEPIVPRLVHGLASKAMLGLLALHIGAALWHIVRRDGVGARMGLGRP